MTYPKEPEGSEFEEGTMDEHDFNDLTPDELTEEDLKELDKEAERNNK